MGGKKQSLEEILNKSSKEKEETTHEECKKCSSETVIINHMGKPCPFEVREKEACRTSPYGGTVYNNYGYGQPKSEYRGSDGFKNNHSNNYQSQSRLYSGSTQSSYSSSGRSCYSSSACCWCSTENNKVYHYSTLCPKVKSIEYYPNGQLKVIEFRDKTDEVEETVKVGSQSNSSNYSSGYNNQDYNSQDKHSWIPYGAYV